MNLTNEQAEGAMVALGVMTSWLESSNQAVDHGVDMRRLGENLAGGWGDLPIELLPAISILTRALEEWSNPPPMPEEKRQRIIDDLVDIKQRTRDSESKT